MKTVIVTNPEDGWRLLIWMQGLANAAVAARQTRAHGFWRQYAAARGREGGYTIAREMRKQHEHESN